MAKIVVSQAMQYGIKGTKVKEQNASREYQKLVDTADKRIDESRFQYAHTYKKASTYLAR